MDNGKTVEAIEKGLLTLKGRELFKTVFVHDSYLHEHPDVGLSYERLEFLGDAVIGLTVGDYYYYENTSGGEGELTEKRKAKVNRKALAAAARKHELCGEGVSELVGASLNLALPQPLPYQSGR